MNATDPDLYLVRIWRHGAAFRATVRRVDDEALHCVHSVPELVAYFVEDGAAPGRSAPPPSPAAALTRSTDAGAAPG